MVDGVDFLLPSSIRPLQLSDVLKDGNLQPPKKILAQKETTDKAEKTRHRARLFVPLRVFKPQRPGGNGLTVMLRTFWMLVSLPPTCIDPAKYDESIVVGHF